MFRTLVLLATIACAAGGHAVTLVFQQQPHDAMVGAPIGPVTVAAPDGTPVTVALSDAHGATLGGTLTVTAVTGSAAFANLTVDKPGAYAVVAHGPGVQPETSAAFTIAAGPPAKLAFIKQPASGNGMPLSSFQVAILDDKGNVSPVNQEITLYSHGWSKGAATVAGVRQVVSVAGIATFDKARIDRPARGIQLDASLTLDDRIVATSDPFDVAIGPFVGLSAGWNQTYLWTSSGVTYVAGHKTVYYPDDSSVPVMVGNGILLKSAGSDGDFSCGLTPAGAAECWGHNEYGQSGISPTMPDVLDPNTVSGGHTFTALTVGGRHVCGLTAEGAAYCWGSNADGALGDGSSANVDPAVSTPSPVAGGLRFAMLSAGYAHSCGITIAGAAYCWGADASGELGDDGSGYGLVRRAPVAVTGNLTVKSIAAGTYHTCGLTTAGAAYCWGSGDMGQRGDGTRDMSLVPKPVATATAFTSLSAGGSHTCALTSTGMAFCWGGDASNYGIPGGSLSPQPVPGGIAFSAISAGGQHTCGLTAAGAAWCWGHNAVGQLGDGTTSSRTAPVAVVTQ